MKRIFIIVSSMLALVLLVSCAERPAAKVEETPSAVKVESTPTQTAITQTPTQAPKTPTPEPTLVPTKAPDVYAGGISSDSPCTVDIFDTKNNGMRKPYCGTGHNICIQFYATTDFTAVGFESPTWERKEGYAVELALYEWDTDYYTTLECEPVAAADLENWKDNSVVYLEFEEPLYQGEYILSCKFTSSQDMCNGGMWYIGLEDPAQIVYVDDEIWYDCCICTKVKYAKTPVNKYGPLSDPGIE